MFYKKTFFMKNSCIVHDNRNMVSQGSTFTANVEPFDLAFRTEFAIIKSAKQFCSFSKIGLQNILGEAVLRINSGALENRQSKEQFCINKFPQEKIEVFPIVPPPPPLPTENATPKKCPPPYCGVIMRWGL